MSKLGFQINFWNHESSKIQFNTGDTVFIDDFNEFGYDIAAKIGNKNRIFFINEMPKYSEEFPNHEVINPANCADHLRFPDGEIKEFDFDYVYYSREYNENLLKHPYFVIYAGPFKINKASYIGNLKNTEVIAFAKSGNFVLFDQFLLPELVYYKCPVVDKELNEVEDFPVVRTYLNFVEDLIASRNIPR